ncbi:MAG: FMN-binding protein [Aestuariibacter sp.]|nr:FMN-binding protein [Aestuariibacter sp.]
MDSVLNSRFKLDRQIDGITGATLSVRAVTRLARMALYLHSQIKN